MKSIWLKVDGSKVLDGKEYRTFLYSQNENQVQWQEYDLLLREDSGKIYSYVGEGKEERLLYDFNMQVGDSITYDFNSDALFISKVVDIKDSLINNSIRKVFYISNYLSNGWYSSAPEVWIESIGSLWGLERETLAFHTGGDLNWDLLCFYQNEELVFHNNKFPKCYYNQLYLSIDNISINNSIKTYPNPSSGYFNIEVEDGIEISDLKVFDINGKLIQTIVSDHSSKLSIDLTGKPKGVYFLQAETDKGMIYKKIILN
jgi:hypothetical protein